MNLRPRTLKIEGPSTIDNCQFLDPLASTLQSLSISAIHPIRHYFSKMTKLTTLHLKDCGGCGALTDTSTFPSLTSISIFGEVCKENRCPFHTKPTNGTEEDPENKASILWWATPSGLRLAQNLLELNLRSQNCFFALPTKCVNLTKLTWETNESSHYHRELMVGLSSSFSSTDESKFGYNDRLASRTSQPRSSFTSCYTAEVEANDLDGRSHHFQQVWIVRH